MDDLKTDLPFSDYVTKNALHFAFRKHTKIERILKRIDVELRKDEAAEGGGVRQFLFYGIGDGCERSISCVEVFKSRMADQGRNVFQWNTLNSTKTKTPTSSSKCDEMEILSNPLTMSVSKEQMRQPLLTILISLDPFPTTDNDNSLHSSLSQQRSDQKLCCFAAQLDNDDQQQKQKRKKKFAVGMAKRTETDGTTKTTTNKWKRPAKGAAK